MENNNNEFLNGFIFKRPHSNAPKFVKGHMSVKVSDAIAYLQANQKADGWLNADLLVSKDGNKLYFKLNTWEKPADAQNPVAQQTAPQTTAQPITEPQPIDPAIPEYPTDEIDPQDIPF